ncbi:MAG: hypothetical protein ACYSSO_03640 [Planctomycetota bacterium]|jgi:hypothetical protein
MSSLPDWLPELILLEHYQGDWQKYEDAVYSKFYGDFIASRPIFQGMPVYVKRFLEKGKERGFWHIITEGPIEEQRIPDVKRCERIAWIRKIIDHSNDPLIKKWPKKVGNKTRHLLWLEEAEYLVVLEKRKSAWVLWTAYCVTQPHRKRKLKREYEASQNS